MQPQNVLPVGYFDNITNPLPSMVRSMALLSIVFGAAEAGGASLNLSMSLWPESGVTVTTSAINYGFLWGEIVVGAVLVAGGTYNLAKSGQRFLLAAILLAILERILHCALLTFNLFTKRSGFGGANDWKFGALSLLYTVTASVFLIAALLIIRRCNQYQSMR